MEAAGTGRVRLLRDGPTQPAAASWLALLALLACFAWTGIRGLDFGHHWDEHQHIGRTARYVSTGILIQEDYNYPSLTVRLLDAALLPEKRGDASAERLREVVASDAFRLRARCLFLLLSSLVGVWVFLVLWLLCQSSGWALLGAGFTLGSWEIAYHARWIAPDALVMQFALLSQLLALVALRRGGLLPLLAAAGAAALACSAKWTGGIALLAVLLAAIWGPRGPSGSSWRDSLRAPTGRVLAACLVFAAIVLLVTPTLYYEPARVVESLRKQMQIYGSSGHFGYDTQGFLDHAGLLLGYYATAALSAFGPGSLLLAALALVGAVASLGSPRDAAVLLLVPFCLSLYLASQRVMIVRNVLLVLPIVAILAALGGRALWQRASRTRFASVRAGVPAACVALLALDLAWLAHAAETIRSRPGSDVLREWVRYVDAHPRERLRTSVQLARSLRSRFPERAFEPCLADASADALCALLSSEAPGADRRLWPANRIDYRLLPSGPFEVNWDYYPTWEGPERVVLVRSADVRGSSLREVVSREW